MTEQAPGTQASGGTSAASKPLRLGLIGCGGIVQHNHVPALQALGNAVQVVALADPVAAAAEQVGALLDVPTSGRYADYRDMLSAGQLDAVSIATPHYLHARQVIDAAEAGVAIISEKPMATSLEDADAILAAVERNRVPYTVVHNMLFLTASAKALAMVRGGTLGEPVFCRAQSTPLRPAQLRDVWRSKRGMAGGGCVVDSAYHEIYMVEALMGSPIRRVEARAKTLYYRNAEVDDTATLMLDHENGGVSTVTAWWYCPSEESRRWWEAHATKGSIRILERAADPLMRFTREEGWVACPVDGQETSLPAQEPGHQGFFAQAVAALATGAPVPVSGQQARHNLAIVEAAYRASEERRAISPDEL